VLQFGRFGGFTRAVEQCSGVGACRKLAGGAMCPSFRATREEAHSTRGRANALRAALAGLLGPHRLAQPELLGVLELCLMCKACAAECPANVDMAALKAEVLHQHHRISGVPLSHWLIGHLRPLLRLGSIVPRLTNALLRSRVVKAALERFGGVDRRRTMPALAAEPFGRWFARHRPLPSAGRNGQVVLFDDCFSSFCDPATGRAAVLVLEAAGYAVELAGVGCCGRTMISKGLLDAARRRAAENIERLQERVGPQRPLIGLEPSCVLTFRDEYLQFGLGPAAERLAQATLLIEEWLAEHAGWPSVGAELQLGGARLAAAEERADRKVLLHVHCHQRALVGEEATERLLGSLPGLQLQTLDVGCCGMAGSFGYELGHYELSRRIAEQGLLTACRQHPDATVLATGFSCRSQLADLANIHAEHPIVFIARRLGLLDNHP
jgi:Fe-S oxidoreductase